MRLSDKLGADVFLWECMGLTPAYVHILQRHWMRDDIATITNTFPDHEDVQGPAGIDIPKVMLEFIPENSVLITSEEVMYPILERGALRHNTPCIPITWQHTGSITDDILNRFPYEEHPNNIALVASMGEQMGIPRAFSYKAMADHVVLDLGVLKTYPLAPVDGRRLQYVMGNSANERLGCLGNWVRMEFDQHKLGVDNDTWVTTVVNNRADRIPRSKVFASILVNDVEADQHFIIGTNVDGFMTFLEEAWDQTYRDFSIWNEQDGQAATVDSVIEYCAERANMVRVYTSKAMISARATAMLGGLGIEIDEAQQEQLLENEFVSLRDLMKNENREEYLEDFELVLNRWLEELDEFEKFTQGLNANNQEASSAEFVSLLKTWFTKRVVVIQDSLTTGEQIIQILAKQTPVGLCHKACQQLLRKEQKDIAAGLKELRNFQEFGRLSNEYVSTLLEEVSHQPLFQVEALKADVAEIQQNLSTQMEALQGSANEDEQESSSKTSALLPVIQKLEKFLDIGDAVARRKKADLIYDDLAALRISHSKAAVELQALTKRQKGGWLVKALKA